MTTRQPPASRSPAPRVPSVLLDRYDRALRIEIEYPGVRKESSPHLVRFVRPAPGVNTVAYSRLDEAEIDKAIDDQISYFLPMAQPFEWMAAEHDQPEDLRSRLVAHGFTPDDDPSAVMLLDLQGNPDRLLSPAAVDVRRVRQREGLGAAVEILEQAIGGSYGWLPRRLGDHLAIPGYLSVYVAFAEGRPACCGWIYFHPGNPFAELFGGATVPKLRGSGLYSAVLAARVQEAARRGVRYLTAGASPMGRPILSKHGFRLLTILHAMAWSGDTGPHQAA